MAMNAAPRTVFFRCDGGGKVGLGHLMRCITLARALRKSGVKRISFGSRLLDAIGPRIIRGAGFPVKIVPSHLEPEEEARWLRDVRTETQDDREAGFVIIDSYEAGTEYYRIVGQRWTGVMAVHDFPTTELPVNILLNQNVGADQRDYQTRPDTVRLLGTRYFLLRSEFLPTLRRRRHVESVARRLLVCMGGSDPLDVTGHIVDALHAMAGTPSPVRDARIIVGPAYARLSRLRRRCAGLPFRVRILQAVRDMVVHLRWADFGIVSGGMTSYEGAATGLPMLVVATANNQRDIVLNLEGRGAALSLGWHADLDPDKLIPLVTGLAGDVRARKRLAATARTLVDGRGPARVVEAIIRWHRAH